MSAEDKNWLFRCGECDGSGIIYSDYDIGKVYCDRCGGNGNGVLIRFPLFLLKWAAIIGVGVGAIAAIAAFLR